MDVGSSAAVAPGQTKAGGATDSASFCSSPTPAAGGCQGIPELARGVELLGQYQGSASIEATYLVRRHDGQVIQVSRLLYLVLAEIDGRRKSEDIASRVSVAFGRTVSAANVEYLVANKLHPLGLVLGDRDSDIEQFDGLLTVKVKRTLVPARVVCVFAELFRPLFYPLIIAIVLAGVMAFDGWLFMSHQLLPALLQMIRNPFLFLLVIGLTLLGGLFHECGHAAACRYGGGRPGIIGVGFYVIWPAFFTDVTDSYRLSRASRIRTDLGGIYFNFIFILITAQVYLLTNHLPLLAVILFAHFELFRQLVPSLRLDGYYILSDIVGIPDLFGRVAPILKSVIPGRPVDPLVRGLKRPARIVVTLWVVSVIPVLAAEIAFVILTGPQLAATAANALVGRWHVILSAAGAGDVPASMAAGIVAALTILPLLGISYLLLMLGRRGVRLVIALSRKHRALGLVFVVTTTLAALALSDYWGLVHILPE